MVEKHKCFKYHFMTTYLPEHSVKNLSYNLIITSGQPYFSFIYLN